MKTSILLSTLHTLLGSRRKSKILCWARNGKSFIVHSLDRLVELLNVDLTDFMDVLDMNGFVRVGYKHRWQFYHRNFRQGKPMLLCLIPREQKQRITTRQRFLDEIGQVDNRVQNFQTNLAQVITTHREIRQHLIDVRQSQQKIQTVLDGIFDFLCQKLEEAEGFVHQADDTP